MPRTRQREGIMFRRYCLYDGQKETNLYQMCAMALAWARVSCLSNIFTLASNLRVGTDFVRARSHINMCMCETKRIAPHQHAIFFPSFLSSSPPLSLTPSSPRSSRRPSLSPPPYS